MEFGPAQRSWRDWILFFGAALLCFSASCESSAEFAVKGFVEQSRESGRWQHKAHTFESAALSSSIMESRTMNRNYESRIVLDIVEAPYIAALHINLFDDDSLFFMCTAQILTPSIVLTAAHCVSMTRRKYFICAGTTHGDNSKNCSKVQRIKAHDLYDPDDLKSPDVALLRLRHPLTGVGMDASFIKFDFSSRTTATFYRYALLGSNGIRLIADDLQLLPDDSCEELLYDLADGLHFSERTAEETTQGNTTVLCGAPLAEDTLDLLPCAIGFGGGALAIHNQRRTYTLGLSKTRECHVGGNTAFLRYGSAEIRALLFPIQQRMRKQRLPPIPICAERTTVEQRWFKFQGQYKHQVGFSAFPPGLYEHAVQKRSRVHTIRMSVVKRCSKSDPKDCENPSAFLLFAAPAFESSKPRSESSLSLQVSARFPILGPEPNVTLGSADWSWRSPEERDNLETKEIAVGEHHLTKCVHIQATDIANLSERRSICVASESSAYSELGRSRCYKLYKGFSISVCSWDVC